MKRMVIALIFNSFAFICLSQSIYVPKCNIIAHRGYWNVLGSAENSLDALCNAYNLGVYGSEFDVWQTKDSILVVCHDGTYAGKSITNSKFQDLSKTLLSNGEKLPTLEIFLKECKKMDGDFKLILEIKNADTYKIVRMVDSMELMNKIEFISFSLNYCLKLIRLNRELKVFYLEGSLPPDSLYRYGFTGFDYSYDVIDKNPGWVARAKELGLKTAIWTVDGINNIYKYYQMGIDFITTNTPFYAQDPTITFNDGFMTILSSDKLEKFYYTTDHKDPDLFGKEYNQPVYIQDTKNCEIKVVAKKNGYFNSNTLDILYDTVYDTKIDNNIVKMDYYDLEGRKVKNLRNGIYIIDATLSNNKKVKNKIYIY